MKTKLLSIAAFVMSAFGAAQTVAHHSFAAEFDANVAIHLEGIVTKVEWTNPHVYFFIEVENEQGDYEQWALEMGSPNGLMRRGWSRDTMPIGTEVIVTGTRARDGSNKGNAQTVVLYETCERLFAGTSQVGFDEQAAAAEELDCR